MEAWLADVGSNDTESLRKNCWTWAPETVQAMYLADRAALNAFVNSRPPQGAQFALFWRATEDAPISNISVYWKELKSRYACPLVTGRVIEDTSAAQATYIAERLIARASGVSVHADDTPENYPLGCEELDRNYWDESVIYDSLAGSSIGTVTPRDNGQSYRIDLVRDGEFLGWMEIDAWMLGGCVVQCADLE